MISIDFAEVTKSFTTHADRALLRHRISAALPGTKHVSRKRTEELCDRIVEFADLGDLIAEPVRTYSTGIVLRLGFTVADSDILIIDEALAVGDKKFHEKCFKKILSLRKKGATLLIVSHVTGTIEVLCERVLWLDHGAVKMFGKSKDVIAAYEGRASTLR